MNSVLSATPRRKRGIVSVISTIILLLITIALVGSAYTFLSGYSGGLTAQAIQVRDVFGNTVVVSNIGTEPVSSDEIALTINGDQGTFTTTQIIQPGQSASLTIASGLSVSNVEIRIRGPGSGPGAVSYITDLEEAVAAGQDTTAPTVVMLEPFDVFEPDICTVEVKCSAADGVGLQSLSVFYYYSGDTGEVDPSTLDPGALRSETTLVSGQDSGPVPITTLTYPTVNYGPYYWYCTATDAAGNENTVNSQIGNQFLFTILDGYHPPEITAPTLPSSSPVSDDLTCTAGAPSDLDCTAPSEISVHHNWECSGAGCGGTPVIALNLPFDADPAGSGTVTDISPGPVNNGQLGSLGGSPPGSSPSFISPPLTPEAYPGSGGAYDFGNSGGTGTQHIKMADDPALDFTASEPLTIEGWIRMDERITTTSTSRVIVEKFDNTGDTGYGYVVRFVGTATVPNQIRVRFQQTSGASVLVTSTGGVLDDGNYHHFAIVRKTTPTKQVQIYIDGQDVAPVNSDGLTGSFATGAPLYIGNGYDDTISVSDFRQGLDGAIDELLIWRRALSPEEIRQHAGLTTGSPDYSTLVNEELAVDNVWTCSTTPIDPPGIAGTAESSGTATIGQE